MLLLFITVNLEYSAEQMSSVGECVLVLWMVLNHPTTMSTTLWGFLLPPPKKRDGTKGEKVTLKVWTWKTLITCWLGRLPSEEKWMKCLLWLLLTPSGLSGWRETRVFNWFTS